MLHRGPDAVYVDVDGWCVGVVGTRATAVPCALRTSLDTLPDVAAAAVRDGVLHLDDEPARHRAGWWTSGCPRLALARRAPDPVDVADLVGRGDGLTPYGDDVLCGWLAVHRAAGVATPEVDAAVRALRRTDDAALGDAARLRAARRGDPGVRRVRPSLGGADEAARADGAGRRSATRPGRGLLEGARRALGRVAA